MRIENYLDLAKAKNNIKSNNELARVMGMSGTAISWIYTKKAKPTEDTMIKLADLAGVDKKIALIDLNIYRFENNPELKNIWEEIKNLTETK